MRKPHLQANVDLSQLMQQCPCTKAAHGQLQCKLAVRANLPGATIYALVPRAPALDLCPGGLATADAQ
jgi:hypothetical protein